jgi:hypothetical protein
MIPKQDHPGHYWRTDDAANIAYRIGSNGTVSAPSVKLEVSLLECIGPVEFGPARPDGSTRTKWTGDYKRFGLYSTVHPFFGGRTGLVIIQNDGAGLRAYFVYQLDALETFTQLYRTLPQPLLWDVLSALTSTYRAGVRDGQRRVQAAFLEGRLKKRRKNNRVTVEELPPVAAAG